MYQEEYLPDDASLQDDYVSDVSSDETSSEVDTVINERRRINREYKRMDKHYYCMYEIHRGKKCKIESYSSPVVSGGYIRHATSGVPMDHRCGTKYDDLYFTVVDTTAPYDKEYLEPRKLYYNTPEEFERHRLVTLPQETKQAWHEKNMIAKARLI